MNSYTRLNDVKLSIKLMQNIKILKKYIPDLYLEFRNTVYKEYHLQITRLPAQSMCVDVY